MSKSNFIVIGVSGKIGSGKTTFCEAFKKSYESNTRVLFRNFGDALKEQVSAHYGFPLEWCYSQHGKKRMIETVGKSIGTVLQDWGTALRQNVHDDVWVSAIDTWMRAEKQRQQETKERLQEQLKKHLKLADADKEFCFGFSRKECAKRTIVLVGDVRFPNEFRFIREKCDGFLVRLDGDPARVRASSNRDLNHISETALDDADTYRFDVSIDSESMSVHESLRKVIKYVETVVAEENS